MHLDGIHVALRQRTSWEAVDLGMALVRQHAGVIARSWMLFGLPLFVVLNAIGWAIDTLWLAALLMWWLKPWFDQLVLHILSRAVFTTPPGARETVRRQFNLRAVLPWLLWRRIDLTRGLSMPVALLEGLRGRERSARSAVLGRASTSPVAIGLCIVLLHIEVAISLSVFVLALMFVPFDFLSESAQIMYEVMFEDPPRWAQVLTNLVGFLAMSVVEPLFVGAGFALYLNRRTQLEAWDIELAFRRIAQRLAMIMLILVAVPLAGFPTLVEARAPVARSEQEIESAPIAVEDAAGEDVAAAEGNVDEEDVDEEGDGDEDGETEEEWSAEVIESRALEDVFAQHQPDPAFASDIGKTLAAPVFGEKKKLTRWESIDDGDDAEKSGRNDSTFVRGLSALFGFFAEFGLWILLAVLIAFIIVRASAWRLPLLERLRGRARESNPTVEADHEPETLPRDLLAVARALFARGAVRAAMALLYRGACAAVPERLGRPLTPGATESEVLRMVREIADEEVRAVITDIVRQWQRAAYAGDLPDAARFAALTARCPAAGVGAA
jgi:hypothetical protein